MNIDFLIKHHLVLKRIFKSEKLPLSTISGNNMYPVINAEKGTDVAKRFVNGLCSVGLGEVIVDQETKQKCFKRFHPDDEDCPDKENLKLKWKKLCID